MLSLSITGIHMAKSRPLSSSKSSASKRPTGNNRSILLEATRALSTRTGVFVVALLAVVAGYLLYTGTQAAGGYEDPLRAISPLHFGRIDQGVDFSGSGPVYAMGDGVVVNTYAQGWPNHVFVSYRLTSGSRAGAYVYVAEDCSPRVHVGQRVTPSTVICHMFNGSSGIETGWAQHCRCDLAFNFGNGRSYARFLHNNWPGKFSIIPPGDR
jgi:murein DD-endopeptidase MepM/ murein hydrolase activator NlpD